MARNRDNNPPPEGGNSVDVPELPVIGPIGTIPDPEPEPGSTPAPGSPETGPESPQSGEPAPARRRRRRKASPEPAAQEAAATVSPEEKAMLARALGKTFAGAARVAARKRGRHWLLSEDEQTGLGEAWAEALAPYLGALAKHAPIVAAVLVTYEIVDARMELDARRPVLPEGVGTLEGT